MKSLTRHTVSGSLEQGTFKYHIAATCCTPEIRLNQVAGKLTISGVSLIGDPEVFYRPIIRVLADLNSCYWKYFIMEIALTKYDFQSQCVINNMINTLGDYANSRLNILIKWRSEAQMSSIIDADKRKFNLPFKFVDYKEILAQTG